MYTLFFLVITEMSQTLESTHLPQATVMMSIW